MEYQLKKIRNEADHREAMVALDELMALDPEVGTPEGETLELLSLLIEDYESKKFPEILPDPIDAIHFRMEQQGLRQKDVVDFFGGASKASEVLSRKRPLTLQMIKALETGLGIPAKVLLNEPQIKFDSEQLPVERFPIRELRKRGYLNFNKNDASSQRGALTAFFGDMRGLQKLSAMTRKTTYRSLHAMDRYGLLAWSKIVIDKADKIEIPRKPEKLDEDALKELVRLSTSQNALTEAREFLRRRGVRLVYEDHFPQTYLDGAVLRLPNKAPIIGLTLRHDRVDNFWFTLFHELGHLILHTAESEEFIFDDLDKSDAVSSREEEADIFAGEHLVPSVAWKRSPAKILPSPIAAESLAQELGVHPAIVAGKMRHEGGNFSYLSQLIKSAKVRHQVKKLDGTR